MPKNGNNRPLSLSLEKKKKFFPPTSFLSCTVKLWACSFLDYVIDRLLPVDSELEEIKGRYAGLVSGGNRQAGSLKSSEDTLCCCCCCMQVPFMS